MKKVFIRIGLFWMCACCLAQPVAAQTGQPAKVRPDEGPSVQPAAVRPATIREYTQIITTYPFSDPNPIPLLTAVYPYFRFDGFTDKPVQKTWKVVELENAYIKVLILPEVGGKVWTAIEKSTGKPFFYFNHTLKFRDVAMRGPWTSGGLESNFGIIGHTPNCATPVDYLVRSNPDGSVSCIIGVLDLLTRSNWRMEINLPADKAYFTTRAFWYNGTEQAQPYYHWMNAGLPAKGNLEFIYPGNRYLGHQGEYADWPVNKTNGKKINFYEQNDFGGPKSYHVFGKYTDFFGAYWHDDDFGMARYSTRDDKAGKKIWIWGLSGAGMIWEKLLTDTDGQYVETQSGRLFNQTQPASSYTPFKHDDLSPYQTDSWKEYWYPVLRTGGFVAANEYGALNLLYENGWVKVRFSPVQAINDSLVIKTQGKTIYSKLLRLTPLQVFADSIRREVSADSLVARLGDTKLVYHSDPGEGVLSRPVETPKDFDTTSAYGLYVLAREASDEKDYPEAEGKLKAALDKDPRFLPALVEMAALLYRNMRYPEALDKAREALSIDTYDGGANYYYGLINEALHKIPDARDGLEIATLSVEYRSAAYTRLSKVYLAERNYDRALSYAQKAVDYNRYDMDALQTQAVIYRYLGRKDEAERVLHDILDDDALNHFARFELYWWKRDDSTQRSFVAGIRNEMPAETYMELGIWYYDRACYAEAKAVLTLCPPGTLRDEWLAFLDGKALPGGLDPAFVFPFREETADMLSQLRGRGDNWILKYELALIYKDRNRIAESKALLTSCGDEPRFAPFYAVRAAICTDDSTRVLADLSKAVSLDDQWRYRKLLINYYMVRGDYARALSVAAPFYRAHPENYIMGMQYAKVLLLDKEYKQADGVLAGLNIIPFEGATEGRELYMEAKLMQGLAELNAKRYKRALSFVDQSREWPEHLGSGKPYADDIDSRLEDWMAYLCVRGATGALSPQNMETALPPEKDAAPLSPAERDLLEKIVRFNPRQANTIRNFYPSNALVTAWALEQLDRRPEAVQWLDEQCKAFPGDKVLLWCRETFGRKTSGETSGKAKDGSVPALEQIIKMLMDEH
jgi:tetratricopeptide (TPR) repeat protein